MNDGSSRARFLLFSGSLLKCNPIVLKCMYTILCSCYLSNRQLRVITVQVGRNEMLLSIMNSTVSEKMKKAG